jgi:glucose-1-phosphatase
MNASPAVVFDLGKVLLDFDYGKVAARMLQHCKLSRNEIIRALNQSPLLHRYETGLMTTSEFFNELKVLSQFCGEFEQFEPIFADIFTPIPEMIDLFMRIRQRGIATYVFSNTNEIAVKHIRATYPFFAHFDGYVFSYEHRCMKPNPGIYEVVENHTKRNGKHLVYIDDRLENVQQGLARGWNAIQHNTPKETAKKLQSLRII